MFERTQGHEKKKKKNSLIDELIMFERTNTLQGMILHLYKCDDSDLTKRYF